MENRLFDDHLDLISSLAEEIRKHADTLSHFASRQGLRPSLAAGGDSLHIPATEKDVLQAKSALLHATIALQSLVKGPRGVLMSIGAHEVLCLQAIIRFKIAEALKPDERVSFDELSQRCGLNVHDLQRILRYSMTNFIFCEPTPGMVGHTSISRLLASENDSPFRDYIANICEVRFPASAHAVDALETYGQSQDPSQSGFSLSRNIDRGLYDELASHPDQAYRWNRAMSALAQQNDVDWISASFLSLDIRNPLIVDVGGGRGDISLNLAQRLPNASFIVQDASNDAITQVRKDVAHAQLEDRVQFQAYDFRTEQPVRDADIYYFKNIFHNWPDKSCIEILRNQIPALKPGAVILIDDFTLHEPGSLSWSEDRRRRWMDISMLVFFGSRERSLDDWRNLLASADERFQLLGFDSAPNQHNSIIRLQWRGQ